MPDMQRPLIAVLAVACAALVTWAAISVIDDDADPPAVVGQAELTGLGSPPHLAVGTEPQPGEVVIAEGRNWTFVITARQELSLRRPRAASTVSAYTRPVILNEASAFAVGRDGGVVTLLAGPVDEEANGVVVETVSGSVTDAELLTAHDLNWFFAEIPGRAAISAITARAEDGEIVDEFTLPPMPPSGGTRVRRGKPLHPTPNPGDSGDAGTAADSAPRLKEDTRANPCSPRRLRAAIERFLGGANAGHEGVLNSAIADEQHFRVYSHGLNYGPGEPRRFFQTEDRQELIEHLVSRQARGDRYWLASLDVNSYDRSFGICNVGFELDRRIGKGPVRRFGGKGALDASTYGIAVWNIGGGERR